MANKIKVVVKEVGAEAKEIEVVNSLKSFQTLVDGYIECITVRIGGECGLMIVNEEGKMRGDCKFNFDLLGLDQIFGDVVFVGISGDEFTDCPFSAAQVEGFLS